MTEINALVQEFWRTSTDGVVGVSFFKMRRLLEILQKCLNMLEVCFVIIYVFATAIDLADKKIYRCRPPLILGSGIPQPSGTLTTESEPN